MKLSLKAGPLFIIPVVIFVSTPVSGLTWKVVHSDPTSLTLSVRFDPPDSGHQLEPIRFTVGLPSPGSAPLSLDRVQTEPLRPGSTVFPPFDPPERAVTWASRHRYRDLEVGVVTVSPLIRRPEGILFVSTLQFTVRFPGETGPYRKVGAREESLYESRVVNWDVARKWVRTPGALRLFRSPLPEGEWIRVNVEQDGVYRITASQLQTLGFNTEVIDPRTFHMFTNPQGGRPLSSDPAAEIPENLLEVAIQVTGSGDRSFDAEDAILFYGRGPRGFESRSSTSVVYVQNPYTDINTYWLNIPGDPLLYGKRVAVLDTSYDNPVALDYGIAYHHLEEDLQNPFEGGLLWVGAGITRNQTLSIVFNLPHPRKNVAASLTTAVFGGTATSSEEYPFHRLKVYQGSITGPELLSASWSGLSTRSFTRDLDPNLLTDGPNIIVFENISTDEGSKIHLDWNTVKYGRDLVWEEAFLEFWAPSNVSVARFALADAHSEVRVWNVTDFLNPVQLATDLAGGFAYFQTALPEDRVARFVAFTENDARDVSSLVREENQTFSTLRTSRYPVDHIVIAPEEFMNAAQTLAGHRTRSVVAPLPVIYDEFSGGVPDPLAIRMFLKWTKKYWRDPGDGSFPTYLLLLGDGDYDYRNITGNSQMQVPTFQSSAVGGVSSDERFSYLDGNSPEMATGRLPAVTAADAANMVDKIIAYETDPELGLWRRRVTLVADDFARPNFGPIETTHIKNSEKVAGKIPPTVEVQKIYMEDFPEVNTGTQFGVTRPDATEALFEALEKGTVLINYIGHGSPLQWAQEALLSAARGDLASINTGMRLPVWMAATCSWGRYDQVEGSAMSEEILREPENGGVAIISTTGVITFSENREFILALFDSFFPNGQVTNRTLGAVFHTIKDGSQKSQLFHLFGDPAMKLALTPHTVSVDSVGPDTLVALETGTFWGKVEHDDPPRGEGFAVVSNPDRTVIRHYEFRTFSEDISYTLPGGTLFRGLFNFEGGRFQGRFIVPKDIDYATPNGRLNVYLYSTEEGDLWEALGVKKNLVFAPGVTNPLDTEGPLISFRLKDRLLGWGDQVPEDEDIVVGLSDPLGINLTGEVGHAILLWLGEDETDAVDLTDQFVYDAGDVTSGSLTFPSARLPLEETVITVQAWDNANNVSQKSIALSLSSAEGLTLTRVFNYPNPFAGRTQFAFEVNREAEITIRIFTLSGQIIKEIRPNETFLGYSHVDWDGMDDYDQEIANGAYLYELTAKPLDGGKKITRIGKLAKYR